MAFRMDCCEQLIEVSHVARLRRRLEGIITVSNEFWLISFGLFIWECLGGVRVGVVFAVVVCLVLS